MRHLAWSLCVLFVALTASAQEGSAPLVLEVRAQRVSQAELEQALRSELDKGPPSELPQGQLELSDSAANVVRLTFRDAAGRETTRDLYLAPDDPEALDKITIAAANLVRDQAAALLAELEAQRLAAEPPGPVEVALAPVVAAPIVPPQPPKPPGYDPCHPLKEVAFGADLVPGVGASSMPEGRAAVRRFSLGLFGTYGAGVHGFEIASFVNIDRRGACGFQLSAFGNVALGPVHGVQLSIVDFNLGWLHGAQLGAVTFTRGDGLGAQVGVANVLAGEMRGAQVGAANFAREGIHGAQVGVANVAIGPASVQVGTANVARKENEVQVGAANVTIGDSRVQVGVLEVATGDSVVQAGAVNVAGGEAKVQVGVVNYAERSRASVGALNIVPRGHTSLDSFVSENGTLLAGITHGGDLVRNTYAAGARFEKGDMPSVFALGIGVRLWSSRRVNLDLDDLYELQARIDPWESWAQVNRLKITAAIWLHERVGILAAAGYGVMFSDRREVDSNAPFGQSTFQEPKANGSGAIYGFPSLSAGVRVMLSDPKRRTR